ncbi:hypothetical protein QZH41_006661 [Actinostola sp. cb2023]|nr:hypothetical protein QZH41_006661 [Actinostola sp. cb2023]
MARNAFLLVFGFLCAVTFHSASAKSVNFTNCGSQGAEILSLDITPCDENPCNVKIGSTVVGTLKFTTKEYLTSARVKAYVVIDGLDIPLPIPVDACQGYGLRCPINKGQTAQFVIKQEIQRGFPIIKLAIKGELIDPEQKVVFCFQVPIVISN